MMVTFGIVFIVAATMFEAMRVSKKIDLGK